MKQIHICYLLFFIVSGLSVCSISVSAQNVKYEAVSIIPGETYQTVEGFGASFAYYENWLTEHPNKAEIYEAIFGELSLDILRVRNSYDYDPGMIDRVAEFAQAAENSLGKPIEILSTSWGPPAYLKSNNDRKNGGTLKFTKTGNEVEFDYAGFAEWWMKSLDEYSAHGIYPDYISIQNEPGYSDTWETCILKPTETVNSVDTLAGYNKALDAVYDSLMQREFKPKILGPETSGIGYNAVENYINALDVSKLYGIAHHLYHGVDENDPYSTVNMTKVGNFHPEIPHLQSEYSRGDWFSLAGLIYKSFHDENVVAYLYWDLIWDNGGLVSLDFPWDQSRWIDPLKGYTLSKDFYSFKQFSRFIHPGWQRIGTSATGNDCKALAFLSPNKDSATFVVINRSETDTLNIHVSIPGHTIDTSSVYKTSESGNCDYSGELLDSMLMLSPHSIATVEMQISEIDTSTISNIITAVGDAIIFKSLYPNPFSQSATLGFSLKKNQLIRLSVLDIQGREINNQSIGFLTSGNHRLTIHRNGLSNGLYLYKLENSIGDFSLGRFIIQ